MTSRSMWIERTIARPAIGGHRRLGLRRPTLTLLPLVVLCLLVVGCDGSQQVESPAVADSSSDVSIAADSASSESSVKKTGTVRFEFTVDGQTETLEVEDVVEGATLETVMRGIEEPAVKMRGSASTAFVESIGDNATTGTKGWVFEVDGEIANQGVGSIEIQPPVTISWTYGEASELLPQ